MGLAPGGRIGPHEILGRIGAGGMGEVYRAHDTRLKRDVALKVLPDSVALDPDRLARFKREAEILASIGHPNIAHIYGVEDVERTHALVLEFVDGATLADLIAAQSLSYEDALAIAKQIAEALEAAHEQGIVHRDLKPANIKVRPDGVVKVLDFGLAKAYDRTSAGAALSDSPTELSPAMTEVGVILGTAAYMSPEQARGKPVDKRTDVWAFGCVLYEMLSGARTFQADTVSDTLAAVLREEPDWQRLPAQAAPSVRRLLTRCLEKDMRRRLRDIGDARIEIEDAMKGGDQAAWPTDVAGHRSWPRLATVAGVAMVVALASGAGVWLATRSPGSSPIRLSIVPPADARLSPGPVAVTPDGNHIVYVSANETQLSVRALADLTPRHLTNLGTPRYPFISPDGQRIGFFDGVNALKVVPITGGPAVTLCTLRGAAGRGGTWMPDGTIVFATDDPATGLWRVSDRGGTPALLASPPSGEGDHHWPHALPGGHTVLITIARRGAQGSQIAAVDLGTGARKMLMPGSGAQYLSTGHVIFSVGTEVRAIRFDVERLETRGTSVVIVDQTAPAGSPLGPSDPFGAVISQTGTLVYTQGQIDASVRRLVWVDRDGREEPLPAPARGYLVPRISPEGTRIAVDARDADAADIFIWDLRRQAMTRTTFETSIYPAWSPDGKSLAHTTFNASSSEPRAGHLFLRAPDGTAQSQRLTEGSRSRYASTFTPDGTRLLFREEAGPTGLDVGVLTLATRSVEPLLNTPVNELNPELAYNGRWIAYESNPSGQNEIYVRPFPNVQAGLWQISSGGGRQPAWSRDGRELFYRAPDGTLMAAPVDIESAFAARPAAKVLSGAYYAGGPYRSYDVAPDGKRFLMIKVESGADAAPMASIVVVQHWFEELRRLLPPE